MSRFSNKNAPVNERKFPNIVELPLPAKGLEIELNRRIIEFHKSRHIVPRYGRLMFNGNRTYARWCFADLGTACDFIEQFGGALAETGF
jgi:hypothetical protein